MGVKNIKGHEIHFTGEQAELYSEKPMAFKWPRSLVHWHTYGLLSPFFEGLKQGVLRGTRCRTKDCEQGIWLPPRADCPDCHARMEWVDLPNPVVGEVFTFTHVEYPGNGIELTFPYYQLDVKIPGCCTVFKGYLVRGVPKIGMKVKAGFRTEEPTNTIFDIYWEPAE